MILNQIQPLQLHFHEICFNLLFNIIVGYPNDVRKCSSAWIPCQSCFHIQMGSRCYWVYRTVSSPSPQAVQYCRNLYRPHNWPVILLYWVKPWILRSVARTSCFLDYQVFFLFRLFSYVLSRFFLSISHKFIDYFYACVGLCHEAATLHLLACVCASVGTCVSNIVLPGFA